jgi:arylsulfatase A-like enzyme
LVEHARTTSLRQGRWKFIPPNDGPKVNKNTNTELGADAGPQLYDVTSDPGEKINVAAEHPDTVKELAALLGKIRSAGRSRP